MNRFDQGPELPFGFPIRHDLPPEVMRVVESIGERVVSPDIPAPLRATAIAVVRNVNVSREVPDVFRRDMTDTLGHLRTTLGEDMPESEPQTQPEPDDLLRAQLLATLNAAERRGDEDAAQMVRSALGITATDQ